MQVIPVELVSMSTERISVLLHCSTISAKSSLVGFIYRDSLSNSDKSNSGNSDSVFAFAISIITVGCREYCLTTADGLYVGTTLQFNISLQPV